jgi:hypothetical protein
VEQGKIEGSANKVLREHVVMRYEGTADGTEL